MRKIVLSILPLSLLFGCAQMPGKIQDFVTTSEEAKAAVPFCGVAKQTWGASVDGDPLRTKAQKAAYNTAGANLCSWAVVQ